METTSELFFFFFFSLLFSSIPISAQTNSNSNSDSCPNSFCNRLGPVIRFPFRLSNHQHDPDRCGYPGFDLSCSTLGLTVLDLPNSGQFLVRDIDYVSQRIHLYDKDNCIPERLLSLNLSGSPFTNVYSETYTFINCSSQIGISLSNFIPIPCLSNEFNSTVLATTLIEAASSLVREKRCELIRTILVPTPWPIVDYGLYFGLGNDLHLTWGEPSCGYCAARYSKCGFQSNSSTKIECVNDVQVTLRVDIAETSNHNKILIIGVSTGFGGLALIMITLFFIFRNNQRKRLRSIDKNVELFLESYGYHSLQRYKYKDIKKMTNSFKDKLGQGGYGSVFKGKLVDGRPVAVKVLINDPKKKTNGQDFMNEVATIGRTNHVNIVGLLGFCSSGSKRALVYEFMINGSLEKFIYAEKENNTITSTSSNEVHPPGLGWKKLYQIAVGIARGLEYLHRGCNTGRILHFDIKPHNILLDDNFCPKISDFGLAKLCPTRESNVSMLSGGRGTIGYIAPEVYNRNFGGVSYKSDVYSYGMMVLEMVGGRKNIDPFVQNTSEIYFPHWIYNHLEKDHDKIEGLLKLEEALDGEVAKKMIMVGLWCIQTYQESRPTMGRVAKMLEGNIKDLQMPPNPFVDLSLHPPPTS